MVMRDHDQQNDIMCSHPFWYSTQNIHISTPVDSSHGFEQKIGIILHSKCVKM